MRNLYSIGVLCMGLGLYSVGVADNGSSGIFGITPFIIQGPTVLNNNVGSENDGGEAGDATTSVSIESFAPGG